MPKRIEAAFRESSASAGSRSSMWLERVAVEFFLDGVRDF
jgi:hypothetical protein